MTTVKYDQTENLYQGVVVFPGQGSQYSGMGESLVNDSPIAREVYQQAEKIIGYNPLLLTDEDFKNTAYIQVALLTYEYACYKTMVHQLPGFSSIAMAGHSLGEITALLCANAISFKAALILVHLRGTIMQATKKPGQMLAVLGASADIVESNCHNIMAKRAGSYVGISAYNSDTQLVVSGDAESIAVMSRLLEEQGHQAIKLSNPLAFHSPLMQEAVDKFKRVVDKTEFFDPSCRVYSNVTAKPYNSIEEVKQKIVEQIAAPVRWQAITADLVAINKPIIELGPKNTLCRLYTGANGTENKTKADGSFIFSSNPLVDLPKIIASFKNRLSNRNNGTNNDQQSIQLNLSCKPKSLEIKTLIEKVLASTRTELQYKQQGYQAIKACLTYVRALDDQQELQSDQLNEINRLFQKALDFKSITPEYKSNLLASIGLGYTTRRQETLHLLCFSYAGGSTQIYSQWQDLFDSLEHNWSIKIVPVEYPGRGSKSQQPLETRVESLIEHIYRENQSLFNQPYALFGHSMGGAVAYQLASYIAQRQEKQPVHVIVSACPTPENYTNNPLLQGKSDEELLENLKALNGMPDYVFENDELLSYYLPILRQDVSLLANWTTRTITDAQFPLSIFSGNLDSFANEHLMDNWIDFHSNRVFKKTFSGDHFFIHESKPVVESIVLHLNGGVDTVAKRESKTEYMAHE